MTFMISYLFRIFRQVLSSDPPPPQSQTESEMSNGEFKTEWTSVNWNERDQIEAQLREFQLSNREISNLQILLHGPAGAGKSSFINSVKSAFQHRAVTQAGAAATSSQSHTRQFQTYTVKTVQNETLPFVFNDVMGMEDDNAPLGIHTQDLISALEGHFNPLRFLRDGDPGYISSPTLNDKVHCLVSVMPAPTATHLPAAIIKNMKTIRENARDLGIPQVLILTKIDECCTLVQEDVTNVYRSKKIKQKMMECSSLLGIPMNCIFPVKNYHEGLNTDNNTDALLLSALRQIVHFANDYVEDL